jgi:hypothetical protein
MAIIRELRARVLEKDTRHTDAKCTYSIVTDWDGTKLLQIDTYGSKHRKFPDKASQSIRFSTSTRAITSTKSSAIAPHEAIEVGVKSPDHLLLAMRQNHIVQ